VCEKELQRLATIIKLEKEIAEIKKVVNQAYHRLNALEQECKEIRNQAGQEEAEQQLQQPDSSEREEEAEQQVTGQVCDFTCSSCSVTKPIDQGERKGKQKSSVCKPCANNRLMERRKKSRDNETSRYECVCGSTFQRWGLTKHEQTIKHKKYIKSLGFEENTIVAEEDETVRFVMEGLDRGGVNDPLIVL